MYFSDQARAIVTGTTGKLSLLPVNVIISFVYQI